jgi:hypothetical protein
MAEHAATPVKDLDTEPSGPDSSIPGLAWLLAGLMAAAGAIHFALAPSHSEGGLLEPLGFALAGWFQLGIATLIVAKRANRSTWSAAVVGNLVLIGLWAISRTVGLPLGAHAFESEAVGGIDLLTVVLQAGAVMTAGALLMAPRGIRLSPLVAGLAAFALMGVATAAVVSPEAADHGHSESAGGHSDGHGGASMEADMAAIDAQRCDTAFNTVGYYVETSLLGVDTYSGGTMDTGHDTHGSLLDTLAAGDPLAGRGSAHLDTLVSLSSQANSESAAGAVVAALGDATEPEYAAWQQWLKAQNASHGSHDAAAPGDNEGHGAHLGPQAWTAMLDQQQCDELAAEIDLAREVAMSYPTAADAVAAGYFKVTNYLPGIAAHYMNFGNVDGTFDLTKPEMLLYDGNETDAAIVGLSYYVMLAGDAEPTQGFTGTNDHYHRHVGLCIRGGLVVGDTTLSAEDCAARGGNKSGGSAGWMSHAWVVPGCESPWGLFSGANPMLDKALSETSGTDGGGCAGSGVRDRYDLTPGRYGVTAVADTATEQASGER